MEKASQSPMSPENRLKKHRNLLKLSITSLFLWLIGPLALAQGIRLKRQTPDDYPRTAIVMSTIATGLLALSLIFIMVFISTYTSGKASENPFIQKAISSFNAVGISSPPKPHQITERIKPSPDQAEFITAFGWPDSFVLNLEPDGKRIEIWQYFSCHSEDVLLQKHFRPCRISFINGKFRNIQYADETASPAAKSYRPTEYISSLTRDQIEQEYGKPTVTRNPEIENWGKLEVLMYQKEIIFIFRNDNLWGVVTVPEEVKS